MNFVNWVNSNGVAASSASFVFGLAAANYALIIRWVVNSKLVTTAIRKDPALAKAIAAEINKDVDAVADAPVPPTA